MWYSSDSLKLTHLFHPFSTLYISSFFTRLMFQVMSCSFIVANVRLRSILHEGQFLCIFTKHREHGAFCRRIMHVSRMSLPNPVPILEAKAAVCSKLEWRRPLQANEIASKVTVNHVSSTAFNCKRHVAVPVWGHARGIISYNKRSNAKDRSNTNDANTAAWSSRVGSFDYLWLPSCKQIALKDSSIICSIRFFVTPLFQQSENAKQETFAASDLGSKWFFFSHFRYSTKLLDTPMVFHCVSWFFLI